MRKEPELFRMMRHGYDPDEVLDCFLAVIEMIRTVQIRLEKERDAVYQEYLQARAAVEEEKKCVKRLKEELQAMQEENRNLRTCYERECKSTSIPVAETASVLTHSLVGPGEA